MSRGLWYLDQRFPINQGLKLILVSRCKMGWSKLGDILCKHFKSKGGTLIFNDKKGICYSFNLKNYFPPDLKKMILESGLDPDKDQLLQTLPGGTGGLDLHINVEGKCSETVCRKN